MESELNEFLHLITQAYTSTNNNLRRESEQILINKCCTNSKGMEILVNLMMHVSSSEIIREQSALLTTVIVKRLGTQPSPYLQTLQKEHANLFVQCLQSPQLSQRLKGHISISLYHLTGFSQRNNDNSKTELRLFLQSHCKTLLDGADFQTIEGGLFLFQALISSVESIIGNTPNFEWLQSFLIKGKDITIGLTKAQPGTLPQLLSLYKLWGTNALELCKRILRPRGQHKDISLPFQNFLIHSEYLSVSLLQVLIFQLQSGSQTIISQTGDQLTDNLVNETKANALNSINLVLNVLINDRTKSESKRSPFYIQLGQLIPTLIVCLIAYATSPSFDIDQCVQQVPLQNMVTQMIKFISVCGGQSEFYQLMSDSKTSLLVDVVFPLLSTTKREQQMMVEEPEEFVNLALDTIDKQSSEVPKTAAAGLLEVFCDHIDGSTSFIAQLCGIIINQSVQSIVDRTTTIAPDSPYIILKELQSRYFFARLTPTQRIDTCLTALTIMSYLLARRNDIISILENVLRINFEFFNDPEQSPLITSRLCLFLGYYCDNLFKAENSFTNLQEYIKLLMRQLTIQNQPWRLAVIYQAVDALKNIFEDEELTVKVRDLVPHLFPLLCHSLSTSCYEQHFDMIMSQLRLYAVQIQLNPTLLVTCLEVLVNRILSEQEQVMKGSKSSQLWINKSWNILRILPEINGYFPQHSALIEQYLIPLYRSLENPTMVEYDEDILLMVSATIEKTHTISEAQRQLLLLLPQIHKKQQFRLGQLFEMLNNYIIYGKHIFQDINSQKLLFSIAQETMTCRGETSNEADEGEGVLIIQLAIQQFGPMIHTEVLKIIFQAVLARSGQDVQKNFLKSRLMGVFLCAFLYDFDRTSQLLSELGLLDQIFQQLIDNFNLCEHGYDIKLYVFAMSSILQKSPQVFSVRLIDCLVTLLIRQQTYESKKTNKSVESMIDDGDDSSEECIDDEDSDYDDQKEEAQITMQSFKSELQYGDEYESFKNTIFSIRQNIPEHINLIKNELSPEKLQYLQNVLGFARVSQDGVLGPPRKIVKAFKRKGQ